MSCFHVLTCITSFWSLSITFKVCFNAFIACYIRLQKYFSLKCPFLTKNNGFSPKNNGRKPLENIILMTSDYVRDSIPLVDDIPTSGNPSSN